MIKANSIGRLVFFFITIILCVAGCDSKSDIKKGWSYTEYINEAQQYVRRGEPEKAILAYEKALQIKPTDADTHFTLGMIYEAEWKRAYETAFNNYQLDVLTNPNKKQSTDMLEELKKFGLKQEYKQLALREFRETIKYAPENWKARYYIATDDLNNKRYNDAIDEYKRVIALDPKNNAAYVLLADAYMGMRAYDLAIKNFTEAFKLDADAEYYYYHLGQAYISMNNNEKAAEMFNKLRSMKSSYYDRLMSYKSFPESRN